VLETKEYSQNEFYKFQLIDLCEFVTDILVNTSKKFVEVSSSSLSRFQNGFTVYQRKLGLLCTTNENWVYSVELI
jgi:hypothetical protein